MAEPALLQLEHVTVVRSARTVLDDFSLIVRQPECVAIVGRNGAGKSTLLKLLTRECYPVPSPATVCRILGRDRWNVFELRAGFGIVSNDVAAWIDPNARTVDVVLSGYFARARIDATTDVTPMMRAAAARSLERLGIAHLAGRAVRDLSSGEYRRATIARALVHDPRALVFDEPTTSLDLVAQRDVRAAMRDLARDGVSIVLVTHQLDDVIPDIDRVVLLDGGRVVADGPKAEVLTSDRLSALFGVPVVVELRDGIYTAR